MSIRSCRCGWYGCSPSSISSAPRSFSRRTNCRCSTRSISPTCRCATARCPSMAEATLETVAAAEPGRPQAQKRTAPIVPERSVAGRTLVLLIAIMTFLSGVTLGGVVLVQKSAIAWSSDVGREVTIQIRPVEGEVMDSNIRTVIALAEAVPGVSSARAISLEESQKLLEPWLGAGLDLSQIEIPRLIVVELADPKAVDLALLAKGLESVK